jgi:hypothetical protein
MTLARMLSESFAPDEIVFSQAAARLGIDNMPSPEMAAKLRRLAQALEQVRKTLCGAPMFVSSGDRSSALNKAGQGHATARKCWDLRWPSGHRDSALGCR